MLQTKSFVKMLFLKQDADVILRFYLRSVFVR